MLDTVRLVFYNLISESLKPLIAGRIRQEEKNMEKKVVRFQAEVAICIRNYNFDMVQISMLAALKIAHNCSRTMHNGGE